MLLILAVAALAVLVALAVTEDNSVADVNAADRTLPPGAFSIWIRGNRRFFDMARNSAVDGIVNYMRRVLIPTRKGAA